MECRVAEKPAPIREALAEGLGTAFLLMIIVGSGIMGQRLSGGNAGLVLLVNSLATGTGLTALILAFSPFSGADFNPLVTLLAGIRSSVRAPAIVLKVLLQFVGAFVGVATAHLMFGEPLFSSSQHVRADGGEILGEFIATLGLILVILSCTRGQSKNTAYAVGAYITAAYWFTSSTSFANPAVTLARSSTGTFSGIRLVDAPGFVLAQTLGAAVGWLLFRWLSADWSHAPGEPEDANQIKCVKRIND
jgi:glycerol uptake facilitator-like aquaporin